MGWFYEGHMLCPRWLWSEDLDFVCKIYSSSNQDNANWFKEFQCRIWALWLWFIETRHDMMIFPDQLQVAAEIGSLLLAEIDCKVVLHWKPPSSCSGLLLLVVSRSPRSRVVWIEVVSEPWKVQHKVEIETGYLLKCVGCSGEPQVLLWRWRFTISDFFISFH